MSKKLYMSLAFSDKTGVSVSAQPKGLETDIHSYFLVIVRTKRCCVNCILNLSFIYAL